MENEIIQNITITATVTAVEMKTVTATVVSVAVQQGADISSLFETSSMVISFAGVVVSLLGIGVAVFLALGYGMLKNAVKDIVDERVEEQIDSIKKSMQPQDDNPQDK